MGKKNKNKNKKVAEIPALDNAAQNNNTEVALEAEAKKEVAQNKKANTTEVKGKKKAKKEKKPNKVGRMLKETGSELKKVTWPSFKETLKKTGIVLAIVLIVIGIPFLWLVDIISLIVVNKVLWVE